MTNDKNSSQTACESTSTPTTIETDCNLREALSAIVADKAAGALGLLKQTVWGLRSEFDPASVTMSSTNIPDAIIKLSSVLTDTDAASHKVFDLVDRQSKILRHAEKELAELERISQQGRLDPSLVGSYISHQRAFNTALLSISHDIVTSQEFQDLCGQKIKKVMRLVCDMECYLRELFSQLKVDVPSAKSASQNEEERDCDQASTDALLKELGI